jgi:hypothetical protein
MSAGRPMLVPSTCASPAWQWSRRPGSLWLIWRWRALLVSVVGGGGNRRPRVLNPCCSCSWLLPYAAPSSATKLVRVDSDPDVWDGAKWDRGGVGRMPLPLAVPTFVIRMGALCTPNLFNAIVCDPPYKIGAPILVNGKAM